MAENQTLENTADLQKQNCIFCKIISGEIPSKKVHEDSTCKAILDINPANEGHILLLPKEHYQIMPNVPKEVISHMAIISKKLSKALLISTLGKSTSIFVANGAVAGQKAPHFMMHIIPRRMENEFFVIPTKDADVAYLDKVKEIIIPKLENITGRRFQNENPNSKRQEQLPQKEEPIFFDEIQKDEVPLKNEILNHPRKIAKVGITKEKGYLYYVDDEGDIARAPMSRGKKKKGKKEKVKEKIIEGKKVKEELPESGFDDAPQDNDSEETSSKPTLDDISRMLLGGRL
jgi:histidine triad (HIT) family protein